MTTSLSEIHDDIRTVIDKVRKFKNENYGTLYNNEDLRYVDELNRSLYISAANAATFIDHVEATKRHEDNKSTDNQN